MDLKLSDCSVVTADRKQKQKVINQFKKFIKLNIITNVIAILKMGKTGDVPFH